MRPNANIYSTGPQSHNGITFPRSMLLFSPLQRQQKSISTFATGNTSTTNTQKQKYSRDFVLQRLCYAIA